jgi:epoxide hydrolase-like predicted phosphatase
MIKTVLFDLGGVLFTNGTKKFIKEISQRYNLSEDIVTDVMDGEIGSQYREAKITRDEFWKQVVEKLHLTEDIDKLEAEWIDGYDLIEGTKDIIFELKDKYSLYYLSDNVKERVERINAKYHFMDWFKGGIYSHEVGVRKPDPKIYQFCLEKAEVKPEEAVFIDDKPQMLIPAKEMGIIPVLFTNPEDLKHQLKELELI